MIVVALTVGFSSIPHAAHAHDTLSYPSSQTIVYAGVDHVGAHAPRAAIVDGHCASGTSCLIAIVPDCIPFSVPSTCRGPFSIEQRSGTSALVFRLDHPPKS